VSLPAMHTDLLPPEPDPLARLLPEPHSHACRHCRERFRCECPTADGCPTSCPACTRLDLARLVAFESWCNAPAQQGFFLECSRTLAFRVFRDAWWLGIAAHKGEQQ
jgi:hypothetical protein